MSKFVKEGDVLECVNDKGWSRITKGEKYTVESLWEGGFTLTNGCDVADQFIEDFFSIADQTVPEKSGITYKGQFYPCTCLSEMYALLDALHTIEEITQNGAK